ncbi:MAG: MBL fold metallo-hydrolase [Clostridia bacterium]|nr:MBL fold metallo-hydrolase [Clostridia bacterium]
MTTPYTAKLLYENFYAVEEGGVRMFLVIGEDKAMLVDTGFGTGDLKAFVETLTDKPVFVVTTHGDGDHLGCHHQFTEIFLHPCDIDYIASKGKPVPAIHPLWDGDSITVGKYTFEILHLPGHTPGSVMLLEKTLRVLIAGDAVQCGSIYMFGAGRCAPAYIHSMEKLNAIKDTFDTVLPSHSELPVSPSILPDLIRGAKDLLDGKLIAEPPLREGMPCHSYDCGTAKFLY